ncbi:glycerol-3-phosphate 1-O-acyltransferase PlsY [Rhodoligotrophos defluvii]|uniref:glycerol-3-phosphate 1-O-acyltransferase PlsY n=1 Tax=Rhodoligotrophos defluvii TaxID=2561934 RepID=UPI0010C9E3A4|nr:glycerol-3-phosphate 1-O-acyltransferase PlsY [Rhodoligotrophos defluvii]
MDLTWSLPLASAALLALFGYLCGSIPFGLIITRFAGHGDIRQIGSGNIGTTNVLRTGSKMLAAATLVADALKGTLPVLVGWRWGPEGAAVAGLAAFLGHLFPVWLRFKGGKGVATFLGVMFGFAWPLGLLFLVLWIAVVYVTRYSSMGGMTATALTAVACAASDGSWPGLTAVIMGLIVIAAHHENIARLWRGEESKIKLGK